MSIAFVQAAVAVAAKDVNSLAVTFGSTPTVGNTILVGIAGMTFFATAEIAPGGVTDNKGNTYSRDVTVPVPGSRIACVFRADVVSSSATFTVTVNGVNAADGLWFTATEFSGVGAFDKSAAATGAGTPHATGNLSGTTVNADSLEFAVCYDNNVGGGSITVDSVTPAYTSVGQSLVVSGGSSSDQPAGDVSYRILTSTTNVGASWTGSGFDFAAVAATYQAAVLPVPATPSAFVIAEPGDAFVRVGVNAAAADIATITDYDYDYATAAAPTAWLGPFSDGTSIRPYGIITGLTNGTAYVFRARAVNANGNSSWSATTSSATPRAADSPNSFNARADDPLRSPWVKKWTQVGSAAKLRGDQPLIWQQAEFGSMVRSRVLVVSQAVQRSAVR